LREERAKAKTNRHLYTGLGGSDRGGWCSSDDSYYGNRYADQDYDNYVRAPDSSRFGSEKDFRIPRAPVQPPEQRLGDFDEWHVGRERGLVDDVIEQIREAWDVAKLSTKDIFFKKDSDVNIRYAFRFHFSFNLRNLF
uniref:NADH dehydrogenase [ubiquinone] 1 alpha subcomplex subunit 13 n=1 Tax=Echinostoma caproni TaxID=27848 RepID=A0A183A0X5_9TREM